MTDRDIFNPKFRKDKEGVFADTDSSLEEKYHDDEVTDVILKVIGSFGQLGSILYGFNCIHNGNFDWKRGVVTFGVYGISSVINHASNLGMVQTGTNYLKYQIEGLGKKIKELSDKLGK